jgi:hypothetical protein
VFVVPEIAVTAVMDVSVREDLIPYLKVVMNFAAILIVVFLL